MSWSSSDQTMILNHWTRFNKNCYMVKVNYFTIIYCVISVKGKSVNLKLKEFW